MSPEIAARLKSSKIEIAAEAGGRRLFVRGETLAFVELSAEGFASIGSTGLMTQRGVAFLVWSNGQPMLSAKGGQLPATPAQVEAIQQFSADLKASLDPNGQR